MGTAHSTTILQCNGDTPAEELVDDDTFDNKLNFINCSNGCTGDKSLELSLSSHARNVNLRSVLSSNKFDFDSQHPPSSRFLGTSYWESLDTKHDPAILLDEQHQRSASKQITGEPGEESKIGESPACLIQNIQDVETPARGIFSENSNSNKTPFRAATSVSTECPSSINGDVSYTEASFNSPKRRMNRMDVNIEYNEEEVTVTPRRLFGNSRDNRRKEKSHLDHFNQEGDDSDSDEYSDDEENSMLNPTSPGSMSKLAMGKIREPRTNETASTQGSTPDKASFKSTQAQTQPNMCNPLHFNIDNVSQIASSSCFSSPGQSVIVRNGVMVNGHIPTPTIIPTTSLSSIPTVYVPDGVCHNSSRHVNTLPSLRQCHPIRLTVTESYAGYSSSGELTSQSKNSLDEDYQTLFSYDPYFSSGQYTISTLSGQPYGNNLSVQMGAKYMTLQDGEGRVYAVTRSRHTFIPSHVIYSPKEMYKGQIPSSHRSVTAGLQGEQLNADADGVVKLYPWALVQKEGRRMDHEVRMHMVLPPSEVGSNASQVIGGIFDSQPTFRAKHGFDAKGMHSNTVLYRVENDETENSVPCSLVLRNRMNHDEYDITIAPGIDPLMIICYLAIHSKMDVEPKLCDH